MWSLITASLVRMNLKILPALANLQEIRPLESRALVEDSSENIEGQLLQGLSVGSEVTKLCSLIQINQIITNNQCNSYMEKCKEMVLH